MQALPPSKQRLFYEQLELSKEERTRCPPTQVVRRCHDGQQSTGVHMLTVDGCAYSEIGTFGIKDQDWIVLLQPPGMVNILYQGCVPLLPRLPQAVGDGPISQSGCDGARPTTVLCWLQVPGAPM